MCWSRQDTEQAATTLDNAGRRMAELVQALQDLDDKVKAEGRGWVGIDGIWA